MKDERLLTMAAIVLLVLPAATAIAGGADVADGEIVYPDSWTGVWEMTTTVRDCETSEITDMYVENDTICPGRVYLPDIDDPEVQITCTGTITETTMEVTCSGSYEAYPGCTVVYEVVTSGTRNGDSGQGTLIITLTLEGDCIFSGFCIRREFSSIRTGEDPNCTTTEADRSSWGTLKAFYR